MINSDCKKCINKSTCTQATEGAEHCEHYATADCDKCAYLTPSDFCIAIHDKAPDFVYSCNRFIAGEYIYKEK